MGKSGAYEALRTQSLPGTSTLHASPAGGALVLQRQGLVVWMALCAVSQGAPSSAGLPSSLDASSTHGPGGDRTPTSRPVPQSHELLSLLTNLVLNISCQKESA